MTYQAYNNEIEVQSVQIYDELGNVLIDLVQEQAGGKIPLEFIDITESISSPMLDGVLVYDCSDGDYEKLQLIGNETILITLKTVSSNESTDQEEQEENEENSTIVLPLFSIYSFQDSSNFADTNKSPEGNPTRKMTVEFCSKEAKEIFEIPNTLPTGFIGKIASGETFDIDTYLNGEKIPDGYEIPEGTEEEITQEIVDKRGLVEIISTSLGVPIDAEPTLNDVWIKTELFSYPNKKRVQNMSTLQMLNYCKDYAVSGSNPNAVNYFFWQDLAGFHFRSMDSILYEYKQLENTQLKTFTLDSNIIGKNRIFKFDVVQDLSLYSALSNFALFCYYNRISPNYSSPYGRLMDDREKYTTAKIKYNYKEIYPLISTVENMDPFFFLTKEQIDAFENDQFLINDVMFGMHSDRSFNDKDPINSVLLLGDDIGLTGENNNIIESTGEFSYSNFNSYEPNKWQAMFDCSRLDGETMKKIVREIKEPIFRAKKEYRDKLAYKEKWNIYKYSVCCSIPDEEEILAVIKDSRTIGRNIYQYSWNEVMFLPKAELGNFAGLTVGSSNYTQSIEDLNNVEINNENLPTGIFFKKFGLDFTPQKIGDLSGEIVIYGTTCGITYESNTSVGRVISNYICNGASGDDIVGVTFNFHNDKYSPFLVVEKPNGSKGFNNKSSGAYNLNEILNRAIFRQDEYPEVTTGSESVLFQQADVDSTEMPDTIPASTKETDILIGPGINANKEYTDYPIGFASMPVGSYQRISRNSSGAPSPSAEGSSIECSPIALGQVVKIKTLSTSDLPLYGIDNKGISGSNQIIYYFNSINAQDGNCTTTVDCGIGNYP